jgi:hypothetical protein
MAAADGSDLLFSLDYYEEPDHWDVADFKAINAARSLDAAIMFATTQAEHAGKDGDGLTWREINVKASSEETRRAYMEFAKAVSAEDLFGTKRTCRDVCHLSAFGGHSGQRWRSDFSAQAGWARSWRACMGQVIQTIARHRCGELGRGLHLPYRSEACFRGKQGGKRRRYP